MVKKVLTINPEDAGKVFHMSGRYGVTQEILDEMDSVIQERAEEIIREMRERGVQIHRETFIQGIVKRVEMELKARKGFRRVERALYSIVPISQKDSKVFIPLKIDISESRELTIEQTISEHGLRSNEMQNNKGKWTKIDPFYALTKIVHKGFKAGVKDLNSFQIPLESRTHIFTGWEVESDFEHTKGDKYSIWVKGRIYFDNEPHLWFPDEPYLKNITPSEIFRINIAINADRSKDELKKSIEFYEHWVDELRKATGINTPVYLYSRKAEEGKKIPVKKKIKII